MAKRRRKSRRSKRKGRGSRFSIRGRSSKRSRSRKSSKKSKSKRRRFIRKISSDRRITKREGRRASRKGISVRKIRNRNVSDYRSRTRDSERRGRKDRSPLRRGPSFEPLKIKRGAERADFARQMRGYDRSNERRSSSRSRSRDSGRSRRPESRRPENQYQDQIKDILGGERDQRVTTPAFADPNQGYLDAIADLEGTISDLLAEPEYDYGAEIAEMQAEQERYMEEMAARQAEMERERELAFRVSAANQARAGLQADFRIGARSNRDMYGTGGFKRRKPIRAASVARGIAPTLARPAATSGNTINV